MPIYNPEPVPYGDGSNQELRDYIWRELLRLSGTLSKYPNIQMEETFFEPDKVQEGTILWADGVMFNPGNGAGFYGLREGAWRKFDNEGHLSFPVTQIPSSNPNVLDDYEEGNWTPVFKGSTIAGSFTYTYQQGRYVKIGRNVFIQCTLLTSGVITGATGNLHVHGLPFVKTSSDVFGHGSIGYFSIAQPAATSYGILIEGNPTYLRNTFSTSGGALNQEVNAANLGAGMWYMAFGSYRTDN